MSIPTKCPGCGKEYNLAESMAGKTVRCKQCSEQFFVEESNGAAAAVQTTAAKTKRPPDEDDIAEVLPADEDNDESGARTRRKNKKGPKPAAKSGAMLWLLLGGGVAAFLLLLLCGGGIGIAVVLANRNNTVTPENYSKLRTGMTEAEVVAILGRPTRSENALFKTNIMDKIQIWESGLNSITVTYNSEGKVSILAGNFQGQPGQASLNVTPPAVPSNPFPAPNPQPNNPKPPPNNPNPQPTNPFPQPASGLTRANFDKIKLGSTNDAEVISWFGLPDETNIENGGTRVVRIWHKGNTVVTVISNQGRITSKRAQNLN